MRNMMESPIKIESEIFTNVYQVSKELGRGKFAVVKQCKHKKTNMDYAAKFIRKRRKGEDCRKDVLHEIRMLHLTLSHSHFVHLIEVYETKNEMILVTELVRGGELFQHIATDGRIDETTTIKLMRQILNGVAFLHSHNIAHLDIKPQNILLTTSQLINCHIKLCDLGLARDINGHEDLFEIIGTPDYVAPEILDYQKLNATCDMWSIGVLAYVMLSGCSPFAGNNNQETFLNISQVNLDFPEDLFTSVSSQATDFIRKLLVKEPLDRMTVEQCLEHPWLKQFSIPSPTEHEPIKRSRLGLDDNDSIDNKDKHSSLNHFHHQESLNQEDACLNNNKNSNIHNYNAPLKRSNSLNVLTTTSNPVGYFLEMSPKSFLSDEIKIPNDNNHHRDLPTERSHFDSCKENLSMKNPSALTKNTTPVKFSKKTKALQELQKDKLHPNGKLFSNKNVSNSLGIRIPA